jgi:glycosyltransferase involved in cell wall biosynthesis
MVDYHFPPMAGAGVQRTLGYIRHLAEVGWNPVVLTVERSDHAFHDPSLLRRVPPGVSVQRARSLEPAGFARRILTAGGAGGRAANGHRSGLAQAAATRLGRMGPWIFFPDRRIGWFPFAVARGLSILRRRRVDALYSTSTAVTSHLVARALHARSGIPWVADFQDPWAEDYVSKFPSPLHRRLARRIERLVVQHAARVVVTTEPVRRALASRYPEQRAKVTVIPMGFDPDVFADVAVDPTPAFSVSHFGTFYGTRSPGPFLTALGECLRDGELPARDVDVVLLGRLDPASRALAEQLIAQYDLQHVVRLSPPLPYRAGVERLVSSSVLLLVTGPGPWGQNLIPSKLFEYLAAGRPLLALAPDGAAARLVREAHAGVVVDPDDVPAIRRALVALYRQWRDGRPEFLPDRAFVGSFAWRSLARRLGDVLDGAVVGPAR